MSIYRGSLHVDSGSGRFEFRAVGGQALPLEPPQIDLPDLGKTVEAYILGEQLLDWQYDLTDLPEREVRQIVIAVGWASPPGEPLAHGAAEAWASRLENEARRVGRDRWEVQAFGAGYHDDNGGGFMTVDWAAAGAAVRERHPGAPGFTHVSVVGRNGGPCGQADLGGTLSYSKATCTALKDTPIHETIGHSIMAVEHSGTGGGGHPYGEHDTWMGDGDRGLADFNTPHLYHAGLIEPNNVRFLAPGEGIETWLVQGSNDPLALKLGENKAVLCHVADRGLTRRIMVSFYNGTVRVHEPGYQMTTHWLRTGMLRTFRAAGLSGEFAGVKVDVLALRPDSAHVRVRNQTETLPIPAELPRLPTPGDDNPVIDQWARGQWGNPRWANVQGIHVGLTDDGRPVLHWLTWDRRERGQHAWYWAVCQTGHGGRLAYGTLITADRYSRTEEVGYIEAFWYDQETGIARIIFDHGERCAVPVERRFAAFPDARAGYYGIGNGEGLTLSLNQQGQALAYWLAHDGNRQVWRMISGPLRDMTIYAVNGGQRCVRSDFTITPVGAARIEQDSAGRMRFIAQLQEAEPDSREMRSIA